MGTVTSLWVLWLVLWIGGMSAAGYFQVQNMKRIQALDIDNLDHKGPFLCGLVALVGFVLFLLSMIFLIIEAVKH